MAQSSSLGDEWSNCSSFSNHQNLAVPIVFCLVGWEDQDQNSEDTEKQDSVCQGGELKVKTNFEVMCILVHFFLKSKNKDK
jgi:hypothetical protein